MRTAVLDACFIIDWARYEKRELLKSLFDRAFIHRDVLNQLVSERAISLASKWLGEGFLAIYPWMDSDEDVALRLISQLSAMPEIPMLERPDVLCLVIALRTRSCLLTENKGILRAVEFHPDLSDVKVLTAIDILESLVIEGILQINSIDDYIAEVRAYEAQTGHIFSRKRLDESRERVISWLRRG